MLVIEDSFLSQFIRYMIAFYIQRAFFFTRHENVLPFIPFNAGTPFHSYGCLLTQICHIVSFLVAFDGCNNAFYFMFRIMNRIYMVGIAFILDGSSQKIAQRSRPVDINLKLEFFTVDDDVLALAVEDPSLVHNIWCLWNVIGVVKLVVVPRTNGWRLTLPVIIDSVKTLSRHAEDLMRSRWWRTQLHSNIHIKFLRTLAIQQNSKYLMLGFGCRAYAYLKKRLFPVRIETTSYVYLVLSVGPTRTFDFTLQL